MQQTNELESLLEVIKLKKEIADQPIEENLVNYRVKLGKKKKAQEDLKELFLDYRDSVRKRAAYIVVVGANSQKFAEVSEKDFGCFKYHADDFYKEITAKLNKHVYLNKTASPNMFDIIGGHFEEKALELGIIGYPPLLFESKYKKVLKSSDDMVNLVKRAFNEKVGVEVVALDATNKVSKLAMDQEYSGTVVPVIMHTEDESLALSIAEGLKSSGSVFLISAGSISENLSEDLIFDKIEKTTKKSVENTLVKIRKELN